MSGNGFDPDFASAGQWARLYRAHGVQVVPACAFSEVAKGKSWKRPLLKSWTDFQDALVPDDVFERWYGPGGQYATRENMGVICGRASNNLFVIDLDTHKNAAAAEWWRGLLAVHNNSMDLETVVQRTGGGGLQLLFRAPAGWIAPTNKTVIGVDIRGQGGFAMLAPSLHESGAHYEWLEGRSPDDLEVTMAPDWLLAEVEQLVRVHGGVVSGQLRTGPGSPLSAAQYDAFGHQVDGREGYMRDFVWAAVIDWRKECPIKPSDAEIRHKAGEKYLKYEDEVNPQRQHPLGTSKKDALEAEGRGSAEFWKKWLYAVNQWDDDIAIEARKSSKDSRPDLVKDEFAKVQAPGAIPFESYEMLSIADLKALPDPQWLVHGMVVEQSMGFVFGPPGSLKTFIALGMALSLTTGQSTWWGRGMQRKGAVIYICSEGTKSLKFRISAWERHFGVSADDAPFRLIRQSINFMQQDDVLKLLQTVQVAVNEIGPVVAVFVDTVSRVLPGAEENLQKDMTRFVAACDAVRQTFGATVIGLHHTNANGGFRGSTVMPGAGDFLVEVRREPGARVGSIYAQKIKDDTDGWEQAFTVVEVQLPGIVARTSLVVDSQAVPEPREGGNKERASFDVREQILSALDRAWCDGKPWSHQPNSSRSGVNAVMKTWGLARKPAREILDTWLGKGIIEEDTFSTKLKIKGYRKLKNL